jgi:hypothetical protein
MQATSDVGGGNKRNDLAFHCPLCRRGGFAEIAVEIHMPGWWIHGVTPQANVETAGRANMLIEGLAISS